MFPVSHVCSTRSVSIVLHDALPLVSRSRLCGYHLNNVNAGSLRPIRYYSSSSTKPRISYRVAASCSAKGRRFNFEKNTYNFDPTVRDAIGVVLNNSGDGGGKQQNAISSTRRQRPGSGEDAFFASRVGAADTGTIAFAVADGVGGWAEHRIDPADVSHGLCTYMAQHALKADTWQQRLRPKDLLQRGYDSVVADEFITAGGTTASVGVAQPDGSVELANLGDSGSVLLRLAAVHQYSNPQTHAFNTPYQLNIIPQRMREQTHIFGGEYFEDTPRDAAVSTLSMQHGDVLVLATDGVFDNLNNSEILKIVTGRMLLTGAWTDSSPSKVGGAGAISASDQLKALTEPGALDLYSSSSSSSSPSSLPTTPSSSSSSSPTTKPTNTNYQHTLQALLAASIAGEAKLASVDMRRDGPFAKEAQRYHPGHWYRGGKPDDISALVVIAIEDK